MSVFAFVHVPTWTVCHRLGRAVSEARWCMQVRLATDHEKKRQNTLHDARVGSVGCCRVRAAARGLTFELHEPPKFAGVINREHRGDNQGAWSALAKPSRRRSASSNLTGVVIHSPPALVGGAVGLRGKGRA